MIFIETKLAGAYIIRLEKKEDDRGFNARAWCADEFSSHGLMPRVVQTNIIFNRQKGTLRGMHYQEPPFAECKLFRCTRGSMYDVIIDLRPESPTYRKWQAFELNASTYELLYVPERFGQGFLTLEDNTELIYQVSQFYTPAYGRGIRYDDPTFAIHWPAPVSVISAQDQSWGAFEIVDTRPHESGRQSNDFGG